MVIRARLRSSAMGYPVAVLIAAVLLVLPDRPTVITTSVEAADAPPAQSSSSGSANRMLELLEKRVAEIPDDASRWRTRIEAGAVYNSNVTLAPISRELSADDRGSAQLSFSPEVEYRAVNTDDRGAGPLFFGNFTLNEDPFRQFNLQSYQPGLFVERVFTGLPNVTVSRLQYGFTHDEFDGSTIGNRHALMLSTAVVWMEAISGSTAFPSSSKGNGK